MQRIWVNRLATFAVWLLAAASAVYWGLKFVQGSVTPAHAVVVGAAPSASSGATDASAVARALGGGQVQTVAGSDAVPIAKPGGIQASRFVLTGVVAGGGRGQGIALIAMDAKPARPYRVGARLENGVVLQSVTQRKAVLAEGDAGSGSITLELPVVASSAGTGSAGKAAIAALAVPAPITVPAVVTPAPVSANAANATALAAEVAAAARAAALVNGTNPKRSEGGRQRALNRIAKLNPGNVEPSSLVSETGSTTVVTSTTATQ